MKVSAIVAVASDGSIGYTNGDLIFRNKEDMMFFSGFTQGKVCIVGHNTYITLPSLSNRVIIKDARESVRDLKWLSRYEGKDVVVIGGAATYKKYAPQTEELFITKFESVGVGGGEKRVYFEESWFSHLTREEVVAKGDGYRIIRKF